MARKYLKDLKSGEYDVEAVLRIGDQVDAGIVEAITGIDLETVPSSCLFIQSNHSYASDILGDRRLFETFHRNSDRSAWFYTGLCEADQIVNRHPASARRIFICSPYHSDPEFNRDLARAACIYISSQGGIPIAPHLYFPQFLADDGFEREWGIAAGHEMMRSCDGMVIVSIGGQISEGMRCDIEYATGQLAIDPVEMPFSDREKAQEFIHKYLPKEV